MFFYLLNLLIGFYILYVRIRTPLDIPEKSFYFRLADIIAELPIITFLQISTLYLTEYYNLITAINILQCSMLLHYNPEYSLFWGMANNLIYHHMGGDKIFFIFMGIYTHTIVGIWV